MNDSSKNTIFEEVDFKEEEGSKKKFEFETFFAIVFELSELKRNYSRNKWNSPYPESTLSRNDEHGIYGIDKQNDFVSFHNGNRQSVSSKDKETLFPRFQK